MNAPACNLAPSTSLNGNGTYQSLDPRLQYGSAQYNSNYLLMQQQSVPFANFNPEIFNYTLPALIDQKTDDELYVETWLSKIGKINLNLESETVQFDFSSSKNKATPKKAHLSLSQAKESLKTCLEITKKLESTEKILRESVSTMSTEEWKKHTIEIGLLKDKLTILKSPFNPEVLKSLKHEIKLRKKKRKCQKNKRLERKLQKQAEVIKNQEIHKKIDSWLLDMKEQVEEAQAEELKQKDADCVLSEVTRKKSEAKKQLSLVISLMKLRNVREVAAKGRGEKVSPNDNQIFVKTTETLVNMWENSLKSYVTEEQALKLKLQHTVDEHMKIEVENKEKKIEIEWKSILFGPKQPTTQLYWALTAAQGDFDKFVAIRKSWDTFLDAQGSGIPLGWVLPHTNPNLEWKSFQKTFL